MDLTIIIVTYNSADHIDPLLTSIKTSRDQLKKQVIIVDNASQDDTVSKITHHSLKTTLIKSSTNLGFSRAVNLALKSAKGDYILLLNPDTRLYPSTLQQLLDYAHTQSKLGALAPRLLDLNGRPQASVFRFPTVINAFRAYFLGCKTCFGKYLPKVSAPRSVDVAVMAAFLIPTSVLKQLGGLDEKYFLYYEDIEFCRRLRRVGLPVIYYPKAKVKHAHGASGSFTSHLNSPLLKSAQTYHGPIGSVILNSVLWLGQKYQKIQKRLSSRH